MQKEAAEVRSHRRKQRQQWIDQVRRLHDVEFAGPKRPREQQQRNIHRGRDLARIDATKLKANDVIQDLRFFEAERYARNVESPRQ